KGARGSTAAPGLHPMRPVVSILSSTAGRWHVRCSISERSEPKEECRLRRRSNRRGGADESVQVRSLRPKVQLSGRAPAAREGVRSGPREVTRGTSATGGGRDENGGGGPRGDGRGEGGRYARGARRGLPSI